MVLNKTYGQTSFMRVWFVVNFNLLDCRENCS